MSKSSGSLGVTRHSARERAMELLYESEVKGRAVREVIDELVLAPDRYTQALALGAAEHAEQLIELIRSHARADWPIERMPALDRIVMCMAAEELLHHLEVPVAVVLDEAVELAKTFSTEDSGRFVNGVLSAIALEVRSDEMKAIEMTTTATKAATTEPTADANPAPKDAAVEP